LRTTEKGGTNSIKEDKAGRGEISWFKREENEIKGKKISKKKGGGGAAELRNTEKGKKSAEKGDIRRQIYRGYRNPHNKRKKTKFTS